MKCLMILTVLTVSSLAIGDQYVNGYTKRDGTYVQPHFRSSPDSSQFNNYSYQGNTNPYNGNVGTQQYQPPTNSFPAFKPYGSHR